MSVTVSIKRFLLLYEVLISIKVIYKFERVGRTGAVVSVADYGVPGSRPGRGTVCCGLEQVIFTHCLVLVKPRKPWTTDSDNCDEAGDYVVPNVLNPRDVVSRPDNMDETVLPPKFESIPEISFFNIDSRKYT